MHHPLGPGLAVFGDQARHHAGVAGAHGGVGHVAEQHAVAVAEAEPAVVGLRVAGAELAVVQGAAGRAVLDVDLLAVLHGGHVVVVHGTDVVAVQAVLVLQLPVALEGVGGAARQHFQLAAGGLRHHHVEEDLRVAEEIFQGVGGIDVEADEDEALVAFDAGLLQAAAGLVEVRRVLAGGLDLHQAAVALVAPGVEGAGEGGLVALAHPGEGSAAVLAGVDQRVQLAAGVAGDDHRLAPGAQGDEVVGVGDLAFVAGVDPLLLEDQLHLQVEQFRLGEHVPGDAVHPFGGAEVQAATDVVLPLCKALAWCVHCCCPIGRIGGSISRPARPGGLSAQ